MEWNLPGLLTTEQRVAGLEDALNDLIDALPVAGSDGYGNKYVEIPLNITSPDIGEVGVEDIFIEYRHTATVQKKPGGTNLSAEINEHLASMSGDDSRTDALIPLEISSKSEGSVRLGGLNLEYNGPPRFTGLPAQISIPEDTPDVDALDLSAMVEDDADELGQLELVPSPSKIEVSGKGKVVLAIEDGILTADLSKLKEDYNIQPLC